MTIVSNAFHVDTELTRYMWTYARGMPSWYTSPPWFEEQMSILARSGFATTWKTGTTGTHGFDAGYVRDVVARHLDEFIDEYLRVNENACVPD